jgi:type IV pilus biogenesis protein CpaD/CtpE
VHSRNGSLVLLAATTLVVAACSSSNKHDGMTPPAGNTPPAVSAIANQTSSQDTVVGPIEFGITDAQSDVDTLMVSAAADSTSVFPADGVVLGGAGTVRTVTLTPLEAATGVATITLTVTDPQGVSATRAFTVTVNAQNASVKSTTLDTYAKGETDDPTPLNGFTFEQDADDPATFDAQVGTGD